MEDYSPPDIKEIFSLFDKKGNGTIESAFLGDALRSVGQNPTEAAVRELTAKVDPQGDKPISFDAFMELVQRPDGSRSTATIDEVNQGFAVFDKEANGLISAAELRYVLTSLGEKLTDGQVDELLQTVEVDKTGSVQYDEFVRRIMTAV